MSVTHLTREGSPRGALRLEKTRRHNAYCSPEHCHRILFSVSLSYGPDASSLPREGAHPGLDDPGLLSGRVRGWLCLGLRPPQSHTDGDPS